MDGHPAQANNYVLQALGFFEQMGPAEAIVHSGRRFSYSQTRANVLAMAEALASHGVRGGMTVVAVTKNHPESIFLQLALHLLGCRSGFVATYAPHRDQLDFVEHSGAQVLIHDTGMGTDVIRDALAQADRPVLCLGADGDGPDLLAAMTAGADRELDPAAYAPGPDGAEPQALFYTSGTTGQPKLVLHRQQFYQGLFMGGQFYRASGEPAMRHLGIPAFSTTSGQMPALLALFQGGAAILASGFDMTEFLTTIAAEGITSTFLSPLRLREVLDDPALADIDYSTLRYLNVGGSAAAPTLVRRAAERFGPVIRIVYGLTEAPLVADYPFLQIDPEHPERLGSCGKAFADTRIEVRDDQGKSLPEGEPGEVWAAGSLIMDEYLGQPELTSQTLVDGWLRTGDVGYLDGDGFLYLVDRSKDVVITGKGAAKVYSRVVEDCLLTHPDVKAAAVIGVPDPELGEAVHAFVTLAPGATVTAGELRELVVRGLKELYAPHHIEFVNDLPLTPMDKIDKKALRVRYHG
jgi:acyl-CoA synthetase (AMP-forming)/AMP-acid ligase II